jgi:DNA-binding PadR family transcriptional regulator
MSSELSPTAKVILGFLRLRPRSGYGIKQSVELSTRFFWGASFGQIYPELARLETAGLVELDHRQESGRKRKVYRLTPAGEAAVDEWLRDEDVGLFQYRDEGLLRLFFGDLGSPEEALENVRRMRTWREQAVGFFHAEIEPHAREDAEEGYRFPHYALLFGIDMLEQQAAWLAELERRLEEELTAR